MTHTEQEIASQPDCWRRAVALAPAVDGRLPQPGERVAVTGCGTSWFIAQSYATLRERAGLGETDAFCASEWPSGRRYDRVLALTRSGTRIREADVIGGGSRSRLWIQILAAVLDIPLHRLADGEHGGAFGAARLGRIAATGEAPSLVCTPPTRIETIPPDPELAAAYARQIGRYRKLGPAVRDALA